MAGQPARRQVRGHRESRDRVGPRRGGAPGGGEARLSDPLFHIVLHEPEIPNNTGNIGRTCIACGCALHLIHPLGFDTSEKACRRAGLDYWPRLRPVEHATFDEYRSRHPEARTWVFSTKATRAAWDADFRRGDHLLFGKETRGLPADVLSLYPGRLLALPMVPDERSLNLATAVCAAAYEGIRQLVARGDARLDERGRLIAAPGTP